MFDSFMNIDFLMSFHHPYTFITTQKVATGSVSENGLMNGNSLLKKRNCRISTFFIEIPAFQMIFFREAVKTHEKKYIVN